MVQTGRRVRWDEVTGATQTAQVFLKRPHKACLILSASIGEISRRTGLHLRFGSQSASFCEICGRTRRERPSVIKRGLIRRHFHSADCRGVLSRKEAVRRLRRGTQSKTRRLETVPICEILRAKFKFRIFRRGQTLVRGSVIPLVVARGDRNCDPASIGSHRLSCCGKTNCVPVSAPPRRPEDMLGLRVPPRSLQKYPVLPGLQWVRTRA